MRIHAGPKGGHVLGSRIPPVDLAMSLSAGNPHIILSFDTLQGSTNDRKP